MSLEIKLRKLQELLIDPTRTENEKEIGKKLFNDIVEKNNLDTNEVELIDKKYNCKNEWFMTILLSVLETYGIIPIKADRKTCMIYFNCLKFEDKLITEEMKYHENNLNLYITTICMKYTNDHIGTIQELRETIDKAVNENKSTTQFSAEIIKKAGQWAGVLLDKRIHNYRRVL